MRKIFYISVKKLKIKCIKFFTLVLKNYVMIFHDEIAFINDNHMQINIIIRICIRISSLPYRFDIDTFDNGRSNGIQIDHSVKITNHNMSNFSKEFLMPYKI